MLDFTAQAVAGTADDCGRLYAHLTEGARKRVLGVMQNADGAASYGSRTHQGSSADAPQAGVGAPEGGGRKGTAAKPVLTHPSLYIHPLACGSPSDALVRQLHDCTGRARAALLAVARRAAAGPLAAAAAATERRLAAGRCALPLQQIRMIDEFRALVRSRARSGVGVCAYMLATAPCVRSAHDTRDACPRFTPHARQPRFPPPGTPQCKSFDPTGEVPDRLQKQAEQLVQEAVREVYGPFWNFEVRAVPWHGFPVFTSSGGRRHGQSARPYSHAGGLRSLRCGSHRHRCIEPTRCKGMCAHVTRYTRWLSFQPAINYPQLLDREINQLENAAAGVNPQRHRATAAGIKLLASALASLSGDEEGDNDSEPDLSMPGTPGWAGGSSSGGGRDDPFSLPAFAPVSQIMTSPQVRQLTITLYGERAALGRGRREPGQGRVWMAHCRVGCSAGLLCPRSLCALLRSHHPPACASKPSNPADNHRGGRQRRAVLAQAAAAPQRVRTPSSAAAAGGRAGGGGGRGGGRPRGAAPFAPFQRRLSPAERSVVQRAAGGAAAAGSAALAAAGQRASAVADAMAPAGAAAATAAAAAVPEQTSAPAHAPKPVRAACAVAPAPVWTAAAGAAAAPAEAAAAAAAGGAAPAVAAAAGAGAAAAAEPAGVPSAAPALSPAAPGLAAAARALAAASPALPATAAALSPAAPAVAAAAAALSPAAPAVAAAAAAVAAAAPAVAAAAPAVAAAAPAVAAAAKSLGAARGFRAPGRVHRFQQQRRGGLVCRGRPGHAPLRNQRQQRRRQRGGRQHGRGRGRRQGQQRRGRAGVPRAHAADARGGGEGRVFPRKHGARPGAVAGAQLDRRRGRQGGGLQRLLSARARWGTPWVGFISGIGPEPTQPRARGGRASTATLRRPRPPPPPKQRLCRAMRVNRSLRSLELPDNRVCDEGAAELAALLHGNSRLTTLSLAGNRIGDRGAIAIAQVGV